MVSRTRRRVTSKNQAKAKASPWGDSSLSVSAESFSRRTGIGGVQNPQALTRANQKTSIRCEEVGPAAAIRQLLSGCHGPQIEENLWQQNRKSPRRHFGAIWRNRSTKQCRAPATRSPATRPFSKFVAVWRGSPLGTRTCLGDHSSRKVEAN